jgi:hypothetical protein
MILPKNVKNLTKKLYLKEKKYIEIFYIYYNIKYGRI